MILRLWRAGWTAGEIADRLGTRTWTIGNVVRKHGAARHPRTRIIKTVSPEEAPIEAWQQAVLPKLEKAADTTGMTDATKRALIFLGLLWLKPYDDIGEFRTWVHEVTGYEPDEIAAFVKRVTKGFLIIAGQPGGKAFRALNADEETAFVELVLMAKRLEGHFRRTARGKYGRCAAEAAAAPRETEGRGRPDAHGFDRRKTPSMVWMCPTCGKRGTARNRIYECPNGHSWDRPYRD